MRFIAENCPAEKGEPGVLYVCTQENHPTKEINKGNVKIIDTIEYQDGQPNFVLMEWAGNEK